MKILSFDVGIKNLAACYIDVNNSEHTILDWRIINCASAILDKQIKCCVTRRGKICGKVATHKVVNNDEYLGYCDLKTCQKALHGSYSKKEIKKQKKINANHISLEDLATELYKNIKTIEGIDELDFIVIENQPVLKNPKMKSIQMILYSYFLFHKLDNNLDYKVKLFSPRTKLNIYDGPKVECNKKNKYAVRKYLAIVYTKYFLEKNKSKWEEYFIISKKKDDLADCYLQGLTYHSKHS